MRQIDYNKPLSEKDKDWLRTVNLEDRILANEAQFGTEQSTSDETPASNELDDDYDSWKKPELEAEVNDRDPRPEVVGTGKGGAVTVPDLISALRAWDREHPDAQ